MKKIFTMAASLLIAGNMLAQKSSSEDVEGMVDQLTLEEKVKEAGQKAKLWVYEGQPHAFLDSGSNEFLGTSFEDDAIKAIEKMIDFLNGVFYSGKL